LEKEFNETRRIGTQNRFISFSQTLGGDELARLLPEITDKMSLAQVQSTLQRLMAEVDPGPNRRIARFELLRRWAQLNSRAAFDYIAELDDPKMRHDLRLKAIEGWASIDPTAALEFALETEEALLAKSQEAAWTGFAATRDMDAAFRFVSTLATDSSPDDSWTVAMAVGTLYHNDDLAVTAWVEDLPPGKLRDEALEGMSAEWGKYDPAAAAIWYEEQVNLTTEKVNREFVPGVTR
jgi:hypothetical protein